jgi:hypothetical protein
MRIRSLIALAAALFLALSLATAQESPQVPAIEAPIAAEESAVEGSVPGAAAVEPAVEVPPAEAPAADAPLGGIEGSVPAPAVEEPAVEESLAEEPIAAELQSEVERLGIALEEANAIIDELRVEAWDLKDKAKAAEEIAKAERATAEAAETAANAALAEAAIAAEERAAIEAAAQGQDESGLADALSAAEERVAALSIEAEAQAREAEAQAKKAAVSEKTAAELKTKIASLEARIIELEAKREVKAATLASWGGLRIESDAFPELLRKGFDGASKRMGSWKIKDGIAAQTDAAQYFSRLTFPMIQSATPTLYSFDVLAGPKGWVGAGLHFFAEGVKKPKGYGEGKSLLVWLTRDAKMRGDNETYLQIYRSDDDVNMERVLDAEIQEGVAAWNHLDILYEPGAEFVVIAVNGTVRTAYRTFFGIGTGVSVSLRTLGAGVAFRNFEVRR